MEAFAFARAGGPEVFEVVSAPDLKPAADQVLITVRAIGLNNLERTQRMREPNGVAVVGSNVAGTVAAIGDTVTAFAVGDRVVARVDHGYADQALGDATNTVRIPDNLSFAVAASVVTPGITAYHIVHDFAELHPNMVAVVKGASGGVGLLVVQLGVAAGATVIGIASAARRELVRQAGATRVIAYDTENPAAILADTGDVVINVALEGADVAGDIAMVKPGGHLVSVGFGAPKTSGKPFTFTHVHPGGGASPAKVLSELIPPLAAGKLILPIAERLPLTIEGLRAGHAFLDQPHDGRIVLAKPEFETR